MKNIVIFDLDGTLAIIDHRRHLVEQSLASSQWFDGLLHDRQLDLRRRFPREHIEKKIFIEETEWKPDWDAFFDTCDKDRPNTTVVEMYRLLKARNPVYVFSGRSSAVAGKTLSWFYQHDIPVPDVFKMRPDKDYTPDEQLKMKWLEEIGGPERVFCVFDDRQKVVDMWRSKGITCFQVAPGNF
jgi:phosphoglycolate phosphatase-like HAD superfamily hydrolase